MNLNAQDALERILSKAKAVGAQTADAMFEESESLSVEVFVRSRGYFQISALYEP